MSQPPQPPTPPPTRPQTAAHPHQHYGADRVVTASVPRASADMNVTPLIDVLLVLLVIFMSALPMTQRGLDITLPPETQTTTPLDGPPNQIVLEITADHHLSLNHTDVTAETLGTRLTEIYTQRRDKTIFLLGAPTLRYGDIVPLIDTAKGAGVDRVGIVTTSMRRAGASN